MFTPPKHLTIRLLVYTPQIQIPRNNPGVRACVCVFVCLCAHMCVSTVTAVFVCSPGISLVIPARVTRRHYVMIVSLLHPICAI